MEKGNGPLKKCFTCRPGQYIAYFFLSIYNCTHTFCPQNFQVESSGVGKFFLLLIYLFLLDEQLTKCTIF